MNQERWHQKYLEAFNVLNKIFLLNGKAIFNVNFFHHFIETYRIAKIIQHLISCCRIWRPSAKDPGGSVCRSYFLRRRHSTAPDPGGQLRRAGGRKSAASAGATALVAKRFSLKPRLVLLAASGRRRVALRLRHRPLWRRRALPFAVHHGRRRRPEKLPRTDSLRFVLGVRCHHCRHLHQHLEDLSHLGLSQFRPEA